jgi:hypothetical protein
MVKFFVNFDSSEFLSLQLEFSLFLNLESYVLIRSYVPPKNNEDSCGRIQFECLLSQIHVHCRDVAHFENAYNGRTSADHLFLTSEE